MLTNQRDVFRGQSRSTNMVPLRFCTTAIWNGTTRPWNPDQGPLKVIETGTTQQVGYGFLLFYRNFVPNTFTFEKYRDLETGGYGLLKVIENDTIWYSTYDFLLMFHSNYGFISCRLYIQCRKISWPWNPGQGQSRSLKVVPFDRLGMVSY